MTDRAEELGMMYGLSVREADTLTAAIRAYGDERYKQGRAVGLRESTNYGEGRLAGLEEAEREIWKRKMSQHGYAETIRALKEKP
jgi:hypothetical protein